MGKCERAMSSLKTDVLPIQEIEYTSSAPMKSVFLSMLLFLPLLVPGSELGKVVVPLQEEPSVTQARKVLGDLAGMIEEGDARTVTLGKKMERSIRRIFTAEYQVLEAKKKADEQEARALQLVINGKNWLRPNVHGRINKVGAQAAFDEARTIRLKSKWKREEMSKEWIKEAADWIHFHRRRWE